MDAFNCKLQDDVYKMEVFKCPKMVYVMGFPGMGKTTMCNELNDAGIKCYDIDDMYAEVGRELLHDGEFISALKHHDGAVRSGKYVAKISAMLGKLCNEGPVVIVGMYRLRYLDVKSFVIKLPPKKIYKRVLLRHITAIKDNYDKLKDIINNNGVKLINETIVNNDINILYYKTYDIFLREYNSYYSNITDTLTPEECVQKIKEYLKIRKINERFQLKNRNNDRTEIPKY